MDQITAPDAETDAADRRAIWRAIGIARAATGPARIEERNLDVTNFIGDASGDMSLIGGLLAEEAVTLYQRPDDDVPEDDQANFWRRSSRDSRRGRSTRCKPPEETTMTRKKLAMAMSAAMTLATAPAIAATETFVAAMNAQTEVPPKNSTGGGTVKATLDTATKVLTYDATFSGLTGAATMAHFHGPAAPGANAGVAVPWPTPSGTSVHGTVTLTDAQVKDLEAGKWYANVHTAANPAGEIRGQVVKAP